MNTIYDATYEMVFWKHQHDKVWSQANLHKLIKAYERDPLCDLVYWTTIHAENDESKILYYLFICDSCGKVVTALDRNPDFHSCPCCGRATFAF